MLVFLTDNGRDSCYSPGMNNFDFRKISYHMEPR